jgi:hypothetical protein
MVGQVPLEHFIQVRVLVAQPKIDPVFEYKDAGLATRPKSRELGLFLKHPACRNRHAQAAEVNSDCTSRGNHAQYKIRGRIEVFIS